MVVPIASRAGANCKPARAHAIVYAGGGSYRIVILETASPR